MIRLIGTACLVLIVIVILLGAAESFSEDWKMERTYTSLHLIGSFWVGVAATWLFSRRINQMYNKEEGKEERREDGP